MANIGKYELDSIVQGDTKELVAQLPDSSIDLLVTDPPYFLPVQSYVGTREGGYSRRTLADMTILQTYFDVMFEQFARVIKPSGTAYVFCDGQSYPIIYRSMYPYFNYVRPLIWNKIVSYNGYTWRHQHELIAWGEGFEAERIPTGDGDVLECRGVLQADRLHPAEKPVKIMRDLIAKHGKEKIILDPYAGSCPVAVAAKVTGNHFLCFEYDKVNVETGRQRVADAKLPAFESLEQGGLWAV